MRGKAPNRGGIVSAPEDIGGCALDACLHPEHAAGQGIGGKVRALGAGGDEKLIHIPAAEAGAGDVGAGQLHRSRRAPVSGSKRSTVPPPNMAIHSLPSAVDGHAVGQSQLRRDGEGLRPLERVTVSGSKSKTWTLWSMVSM